MQNKVKSLIFLLGFSSLITISTFTFNSCHHQMLSKWWTQAEEKQKLRQLKNTQFSSFVAYNNDTSSLYRGFQTEPPASSIDEVYFKDLVFGVFANKNKIIQKRYLYDTNNCYHHNYKIDRYEYLKDINFEKISVKVHNNSVKVIQKLDKYVNTYSYLLDENYRILEEVTWNKELTIYPCIFSVDAEIWNYYVNDQLISTPYKTTFVFYPIWYLFLKGGNYPDTNYLNPFETPYIKKIINMTNPPTNEIEYEQGSIFNKDGIVVDKEKNLL